MTDYQPVIEFFVAGEPVPQGSKRAFIPKGGTKPIIREDAGQRHESWRREVSAAAREAMRDAGLFGIKEEGPLAVSLTFYQTRGIGHYGSGRNAHALKPSAPAYPIKPPDVDKLTRSIFDSLTHVVWVDDAQVVATTQRKLFSDRFTGQPGVSVVVRRVVG